MNLVFKLRPTILFDGEIMPRPVPVFEDKILEQSALPEVLMDSIDDYNFEQIFNLLDNYNNLNEKILEWNTDYWELTVSRGEVIISETEWSAEDKEPDELLNIVTMTVGELKALILEYHIRAKDFRAGLPEMQKTEDKRRERGIPEHNTFYLEEKKTIESVLETVEAMNQTIDSEWKGQAFQTYLKDYPALKKTVTDYAKILEKGDKLLEEYEEEFGKSPVPPVLTEIAPAEPLKEFRNLEGVKIAGIDEVKPLVKPKDDDPFADVRDMED